ALGLAHIVVQATLSTAQRGLTWNAGPRDSDSPPVSPVTARVERALRNFLETFPLFAAAAVAVSVAHQSTTTSALGAQVYLGARVAYVAIYAAGIPYLRTMIWTAAMIGLAMVLSPLL
ncbi:MAG: MAPEG family protein, partial [Polyangiales bacterium]